MVLSVDQTPETSSQRLRKPFTVTTGRFPKSAESVFAVMPTPLLVEAQPFLLLSDTVCSMQAGTCMLHTFQQ